MKPDSLFKRLYNKRNGRHWLALAVVLVLVGNVIAYNLVTMRQQLLKQEQKRLLTQAGVIGQNIQRQFESTNLALQGVVDDIPYLHNPQNLERANKRLMVLADAMPGVRTIFTTDATGTVKAANRPQLIGLNFGHRTYITVPQKTANPNILYISPPFKSVLNGNVFNVSRIIPAADGSFNGVVTAGVDPDYIEAILRSALYAPDMWNTIMHGSGTRFLTVSNQHTALDTSLNTPCILFNRHTSSRKPENIYAERTYYNGESRMTALLTIQPEALKMDTSLVVISSRNNEAILATWHKEALFQGFLYILTCLGSIAGLFLLHRRQESAEQKALQAEQELEASRQRLADIFDFLPDATFALDTVGQVIAWNKAMEAMSGVAKEEAHGKTSELLGACFYGVQHASLAERLLGDEANLEQHYPNLKRNGKSVSAETFCPALNNGKGAHVWISAAPLHDAQGKLTGVIEAIRDITTTKQLELELKQSNELLSNQARIDFLTGIYNRRMFDTLLTAEIARAERYDAPLSLIMLDLDHFKQINDGLGHSRGDLVLQKIAELISGRLRSHDIFSRWGGEEFVVLTPKNDSFQAALLAEILRELIEQYDFYSGLKVTVSFGVTSYCSGESAASFIERADAALYKAKQLGRNRVESA